MNQIGRSLTKVLKNFILIALLWMDILQAGAPSLEESRKLQFQQFLNQNNRGRDEPTDSGGDSLKSSRSRFKSVQQSFDEPVKMRQLIESLLEVQCTPLNMTIKLRYDSSYSKLTPGLVEALAGGLLYVGSDRQPNCQGRSDKMRGEISLTMNYDSCTIESEQISDNTILYSTTVTVEFGNWSSSDHLRDFRENYKMTCINPRDNDDKKKKEVHNMKLFEQKYDEIPISTYPHNVEKGGNIFLQGDVVLSNGYNSSELHSFPVNCWLAQHEGYVDEQFRRPFLNQGCPVNDYRGRGMSRIHHMTNGQTKVSFTIVNSLLWSEQQQIFYVHCELLSCVQSYTSGIVGVPKCPSTTYCAGIPQLSHTLPEHIRNSATYTVVAGALKVVEKQQQRQEASVFDSPAPNIDLKCQLACAQTSFDQRQSPASAKSQQPAVQTFYVEGVSTKIAVIISFASFLIGMLMMGALWFVHVRADPKRKLPKAHGASNSSSNNMNNIRRTSSPFMNCTENNNLQQTAKLMLNPL